MGLSWHDDDFCGGALAENRELCVPRLILGSGGAFDNSGLERRRVGLGRVRPAP